MTAAIRARPRRQIDASVLVTGGLVLIVISMVIPLPPSVLDFGFALSIAAAVLVLVMASLVDRPTDFQAFPMLLLMTLVIRLSLNVSSTRLILTQGHTGTDAAGHIINGFASFVAGGSLMVGLTVFAVISIVNFMVITKGSGRMAEVAARFALDSLPGKQMAIDADLNSGAIDHQEARTAVFATSRRSISSARWTGRRNSSRAMRSRASSSRWSTCWWAWASASSPTRCRWARRWRPIRI